MPIITTLVMTRSALPFGRAAAQRRTQRKFGHPQLADDFGRRQVAREALLARRAEAAIDGAHRPATTRTACRASLRDEHGFDRVAVPTSISHLRVPSAET
jgi:hypothetical protein